MGIMGRTPQQSIGPASTELSGYVRLATEVEAAAGLSEVIAVTPKGLMGAVDAVGNKTVKAQYFATIGAGTTTGTVSKPAGAGADVAFVMDEWGTDTDALLSTLENGKPTFSTPTTVGGVAITTSFNTAGEFAFSDTPSPSADIALIYVYTCYLTNLNPAEVLFESELVSHSHSLLSNLDADDHTQYHTDARGDARYYTETELNDRTAGASGAHLIGTPVIGTPTYPDLNDRLNLFGGAGRVTGGVVSDATGETINVTAGTGFIKASDSDVAELLAFDWAASNGIAVPTNTIRHIGVVYGTPPVIDIRATDNYDLDTEFPLARVVNEAGVLHILNNPWWISDGLTNVIERFQAEGHLVRDNHVGGLVLSVTATRRIVVSGGTLWSRLNEFPITAFTSVADAGTFEAYYVDSLGVWRDADLTQYLVTVWNDKSQSGTDALATLDNNKYLNLWVYAEADDNEISIVYGDTQYVASAGAEAQQPPSSLPVHIGENGILIGRIIIKQAVDAPVEVQSVWETQFTASQASDHGNLTGLSDDDHPQYIKDAEFTADSEILVGTGSGTFQKESGATLRTSIGCDPIGTDNSTDVTLDASATTGGMSITAQAISNRAATAGQTGYATAAQITKLDGIEALAEVNNISDVNATDLTDGGDTTLHDHDGISENTSARHTAGTDVALGAVSAKNPPIDADLAIYRDSTAADALVTSTWAQVKAFLKTYFDTLYNKYVHPNHSGDVTSVADGAQTIANKETLSATAPITLSNTPTVIAAAAPVIAIPAATDSVDGYATSTQITKLDGIAAGADVTSTNETSHSTVVVAASVIADHALVRGDGGSRNVQDSTVLVSDNGEMTNPSQPAFNILPASTQADIATGSWVGIAFGAEAFDIGNNCASNVFTAPTTGSYLLTIAIRLSIIDTVATTLGIRIRTSNRNQEHFISPTAFVSDPYSWLLSFSVVTDMDINDVAGVDVYQDIGTAQMDILTNSSFSGVLIC